MSIEKKDKKVVKLGGALEERKMYSRTAAGKQRNKPLRKICPLGMRVLVAIRKDEDLTDSGLYLPEGAKEEQDESFLAEVLEVAIALDDDTDEEANISGVPLGALVLIPRDVGVRVPWDENLRLVETCDILAIVHEVNVS